MDSSKDNKLLYLEGLRGLAALVVVIYHLGNTFAISISEDILEVLKIYLPVPILPTLIYSFVSIFLDGTLAVYIFWFMSAYVISIKLVKDNGRGYLYRSFIKRYFRLAIPVLGSVLFAYFLLKMDWMYNNEVAKILGSGYENGWLGSFYDFDANIFIALKTAVWSTFFTEAVITYNASLWTMKPELHGSLFVFLLFGLCGTKQYRYGFYAVISIIIFLSNEYWLLSFILGFWLSYIEHTESKYSLFLNKIARFPVLNLFFLCVVIFLRTQYNYLVFFNVFTSAAIVLLIIKTTILQEFFNLAFFVWLGKISFSLYLLHLPIICSLTCFLYLNLSFETNITILISIFITILSSFILSNIYTNYVDKFAIKFSHWIGIFFSK